MEANIQFTLPSIGRTEMSRDEQGALIINQATAVIVDSYLKNNSSNLSPTNLASLINSVQGALKEF